VGARRAVQAHRAPALDLPRRGARGRSSSWTPRCRASRCRPR
jgi:hypothetical protein